MGETEFPSLAAACATARNGDIIELRYDGRREEKPLPLADSRITIRAGKGYLPYWCFDRRPDRPVIRGACSRSGPAASA